MGLISLKKCYVHRRDVYIRTQCECFVVFILIAQSGDYELREQLKKIAFFLLSLSTDFVFTKLCNLLQLVIPCIPHVYRYSQCVFSQVVN